MRREAGGTEDPHRGMEACGRRGTDRTWHVTAGLRLSPAETAALDAASDPRPADYPYGELGADQRTRTLPAGH